MSSIDNMESLVHGGSLDTIKYCIENSIPCFTFKMSADKQCYKKGWNKINESNFREHINEDENGFAVVTGITHIVLDFDSKYNPPMEIYETLLKNSKAVEKTPGGFHFWFKADGRTSYMESNTNICWNNKKIDGLDIRAKKGTCYTTPTFYIGHDGQTKKYEWMKGDLSKAEEMPSEILESLNGDNPEDVDNSTIESFRDNDKVSLKITSRTKECLVKLGHTHTEANHSCIFLTKGSRGFNGTANCFSHGKRKLKKEEVDSLVEKFWPIEEEKDEYSKMKTEFEEFNFKVMDPVGFYTYIGNRWIFRERSQMKAAYENIFMEDGKLFIDRWLKDRTMKTYNKVSYYPTDEENVFVIPEMGTPSFIYKTYNGTKNESALAIFDELLEIMTNHNAQLKQYLLSWLAHLVQNPKELPGVAIIFSGQKGAGKDTLGDFIGEYIVGNKYYQNYSNQGQYFDKHDETKGNKFLLKIEELNRRTLTNGVNGEIFKANITSPMLNLNPKGSPAYNVRNYGRIMATTNNGNSVDVGQKERRYVIMVVSGEKIGVSEYWNKVRKELFTDAGGYTIGKMLEEYEISDFNPRVLPENNYLNELQKETEDPIKTFIESVENGEYCASDLYDKYREYCNSKGHQVYSNTKFGTQMLYLLESGGIDRRVDKGRTKNGRVYIIF
jgi:hypothetical protein